MKVSLAVFEDVIDDCDDYDYDYDTHAWGFTVRQSPSSQRNFMENQAICKSSES